MFLTLPAGEPEAGPWRSVPAAALLELILTVTGDPSGRPRVVAVDGRGASGKSTLAARLHALTPSSALVHTDDLAWHEPLFEWGHLLAGGVLRPLHEGRAVCYRPPQWQRRGRAGSIEVPAGLDVLFVEGTGASQREHSDLIDATVWVQADFKRAEQRGIARDVAAGVNGDATQASAFWHDWMTAELAFLHVQRPWERAFAVVNGMPSGPVDFGHVVIAVPST